MPDVAVETKVSSKLRNAWHALPAPEVMENIGTRPEGLTEEEVRKQRERFGPNVLPSRKPPTIIAVFLHQFLSPLIYVLLAAAAVSLGIGEATDAAFIMAIILLNALIGSLQEWKAEQSAAALQNLLVTRARVVRGGEDMVVAAEELVPGDVVLLEAGARVPADARLIHARRLAVDESFLTGESLPVEKGVPPVAEQSPVSQRSCMVFGGATVTSGRATGIVTATGTSSEVGTIAASVTAARGTKPPLVMRVERFAHQILYAVLVASGLLSAILIGRGMPLVEVFFLGVALAVSAVPEGLPVAMTVALSIATSRMAKRNVIVRRLTAVESLGSCTVIASDKTGTLTVNQQTARVIWIPSGDRLHVSGEGYNGDGQLTVDDGTAVSSTRREQLESLARAAIISNEADLDFENGTWVARGDAIDIALVALAWKVGLDPRAVRSQIKAVEEIPYEPETKYAAVYFETLLPVMFQEPRGVSVAVKGAVETVLGFCDSMQGEFGPVALDAVSVERTAVELAAQGYRVLAVADGRSDPLDGKPTAIPPLRLLGLVGFIDPLRSDATASIRKCRGAGVEVAMITGDHPATALALAKELGIAEEGDRPLTGMELDRLLQGDSESVVHEVNRTRVFARVSPMQKLQIVEAFQKGGNFVAVTGDGVNDAPALRKANIGVAMGSGTDVAKDTGSMIVTDDSIASIVAGIEEGRFAYDNVRKVIYLLISTGFAEIVLFLLAVASGMPLPLFAVQLLWLNLVTNGIQDVALAFEAGEPGAMKRKPRRPSEGVFNRLMVSQVGLSGASMGVLAFGVWVVLLGAGYEEAAARNLLLLFMVLLENVHVFNCRSEYRSAFRVPLRNNRILIVGVLVAQGVHVASMYIPMMQDLLRIQPVSILEWAVLAAATLSLLGIMEVFKLVRQHTSAA